MALNINQKINLRNALQQWNFYTLKGLKGNILAGKLTRTRQLHDTLRKTETYGKGVYLFEYTYKLYGMFVDMGVGRGRSLEGAREAAAMARTERILEGKYRKKKFGKKRTMWYSREMYGNVRALGRIMAAHYADEGIESIVKSMPEIIEIQI